MNDDVEDDDEVYEGDDDDDGNDKNHRNNDGSNGDEEAMSKVMSLSVAIQAWALIILERATGVQIVELAQQRSSAQRHCVLKTALTAQAGIQKHLKRYGRHASSPLRIFLHLRFGVAQDT